MALVGLGTDFGLDRALAAQPGQADVEEGVQVLTRGPVHEAFAETVTFDPEPGIVVPKAPPAAIEELPPDQRPEGANVAWIPGYWGWDDERSDFLWVSGIWRALPPGRQWVPGYWGKSAQGFQWTSGYWADAKVSEVAILARAACDGRSRSQHRRAFGGQHLAARLLGVAAMAATLGVPVSGRPCSRIGIGFLPITSTHRAATSSSTATGITRSAVAVCCLRRSISMRACIRGPVSPTRLRR